jgi:hypothetical protein
MVLVGLNIVLDLLVLVLLFQSGFSYFVSLSVWIAYALLVVVPWLSGRALQKTIAQPAVR